MSSHTFASIADVFPPGTTVGAYAPPSNPEARIPSGSPVTTAVVANDGSLSFTGLADSTRYVAYESGTGRMRGFLTTPAGSSQVAASADQVALAARRNSLLRGLSVVADLGRAWNGFSSNPFNAGLGGMYKKWATAVADATDLVLVYTNWGGSLIGSAAPVGAPIYVRAGVGNDVDVYPATFLGGTVSEVTVAAAVNGANGAFGITDPIPVRIYAGQRFPVGTYVRVDQLVGTGDTHTNTTIDNFVPTSGGVPYKGQFISGAGIPAGATIASTPVLAAGKYSFTISAAATATAAGVAITANGSWPISGSIYSRGSTAAGDAGSVSASPTDRTADTSLLTMTNGGASLGYWPVVMGRSKGLNRAMIAVVDSIGSGAHDNTPAGAVASATGLDRLGFPERTWGDDGIITLGVGGMAISDLVTPAATAAGGSKMAQVQKYAAGATGALFEIGTNDVAGYPGTSIATLQARLIKLWQRVSGDRSIPGWQGTFLPRPASSTDSWLTVANQTLGALEPGRLALNAWLRDGAPLDISASTYTAAAVGATGANIVRCGYASQSGGVWSASSGSPSHPLRGVLELADIVESARDSGKWKNAAWIGSGTTTSGTNTITGVTTTSGAFSNGDASGNPFLIAGPGIPANTTGTLSGGTITLSQNANASATATIGQPYTDDGTHPLMLGHLLLQSTLQAGSPSGRSIVRDSMNAT